MFEVQTERKSTVLPITARTYLYARATQEGLNARDLTFDPVVPEKRKCVQKKYALPGPAPSIIYGHIRLLERRIITLRMRTGIAHGVLRDNEHVLV